MFIGIHWALLFATALIVSLVSIPVIIFAAQKMNLFDAPNTDLRGEKGRRKIHLRPIPRVGGLGMVLAFFLSVFLWSDSVQFLPIYLGSIVLFLLGLLDDLRPIPALFRLLIQSIISVSVVLICNLDLEYINLLGAKLHLGPIFGGVLSTFILVGAINSVNMIDGLDGLAGGLVLVGISMLCYIHFLSTGQTWIIGFFGLGLMGAILGFLKYNAYPAKIFMGDGGSTWLGFYCGFILLITLGSFTLNQNFEFFPSAHVPVPASSGILCLAIPVLDTAAVIMHRLMKGHNPFKPDLTHFHHILVQVGINQKHIIITLYLLSLIFGTIAVFPVSYPKYYMGWLPPVVLFLALAVVVLIKQPSSQLRRLLIHKPILQFLTIVNLPDSKRILRGWALINRYLMYGVIAISPFLAGSFATSVGQAAAAMGVILLLSLFIPAKKDDFSQALLIVLGLCVLLVAVNENHLLIYLKGEIVSVQSYYNAFFLFLGPSVALYFLASFRVSSFNTNPTDFLLLTIPLCLLIVPEPYQSVYRLSIISARALVFFFALRTFVFGYKNIFRRFKLITMMALFYIAANSLLGVRFIY